MEFRRETEENLMDMKDSIVSLGDNLPIKEDE